MSVSQLLAPLPSRPGASSASSGPAPAPGPLSERAYEPGCSGLTVSPGVIGSGSCQACCFPMISPLLFLISGQSVSVPLFSLHSHLGEQHGGGRDQHVFAS